MPVLSDQGWLPEQGLTDFEAQVQETAHRFAADVMRPAGIALDRLQPEQVIARGSQLWDVFDGYWDLGLDLKEIADELNPVEVTRLTFLVHEELGWGDTGLGWSLYASGLAQAMIKNFGRDDLAELCPPGTISMWSITEPGHGSDMLDFSHGISPAKQGGLKSNCVVIRQGDKLLVRGQKSSWGSNGSIADVSALFCRYDDGSGEAKNAAFIVPLDLPGVSRGKPLDKLGVRSLTDAELYFDDVEIPASYMLCPPEAYDELLAGILIGANPGMAIFSVGQARAAFELALSYAKQRIQGGKPIFEHQAVKLKLFDMYRKIQAARALVRQTMLDHAQFPPRFENAVASKVTGTQIALEVTNQAFEIFGGNATAKEYPIEKLLRDARMGTIADGTNDVLSLMAATLRF
jgi:alkylation response protein AidB-like acyl-CoA dehydrogenase